MEDEPKPAPKIAEVYPHTLEWKIDGGAPYAVSCDYVATKHYATAWVNADAACTAQMERAGSASAGRHAVGPQLTLTADSWAEWQVAVQVGVRLRLRIDGEDRRAAYCDVVFVDAWHGGAMVYVKDVKAAVQSG